MPSHLGPGPVFAYECLVIARRWQSYAVRSAFLLVLLVGLIVVWSEKGTSQNIATFAQLAGVGRLFHQVIVGVEIALVLLAAPAATAGAICLDKARGTLAHMLVTDLSNAEIVLGKLAARLLPVLGAVLCTAPLLMIGTLLGGVDPTGLFGSLLIILGVAILGCSLAICLSVWGKKTHEVVLATYVIWAIWLLAGPTVDSLSSWFGLGRPDIGWLLSLNPFALGFRAIWMPTSLMLHARFLAASVIVSAGLVALATWRVRSVAASQAGRVVRKRLGRLRLPRVFLTQTWLPGPSLDGNPVLWREWHNARPSEWSARIWGVYFGFAILFTGLYYLSLFVVGNDNATFAAWINALLVAIGLLFVTVSAATTLAEEQVRGSLDVLMSTPLSTRSIVLGKWLGTFRMVPAILICPAIIALIPCLVRGRLFGWLLLMGMGLMMGASAVSLGLAAATGQKRVGRAVALAVSLYLVVTVGWPMIVIGSNRLGRSAQEAVSMVSPFFGLGEGTFELLETRDIYRSAAMPGAIVSFLFHAAAFGILLGTILAIFDRRLGRMPGTAAPVSRKVPEPALAELVS